MYIRIPFDRPPSGTCERWSFKRGGLWREGNVVWGIYTLVTSRASLIKGVVPWGGGALKRGIYQAKDSLETSREEKSRYNKEEHFDLTSLQDMFNLLR
jgi:hypothetical protein